MEKEEKLKRRRESREDTRGQDITRGLLYTHEHQESVFDA